VLTLNYYQTVMFCAIISVVYMYSETGRRTKFTWRSCWSLSQLSVGNSVW